MKLSLLQEDFLKDKDTLKKGLTFQIKHSDLVDKTISSSVKKHPLGAGVALVALGGYGRHELAPFSDIDLLLIHEKPLTREQKKAAESLQRALWDSGLKPGFSVRSLKDCEAAMGQDLAFLTSLLEKRLIWGAKPAWQKLEKAFRRHIKATPPGFFIAAKLEERDTRHRKLGDNRYQLEPNVKEGKGALRDIHTLLWIANFLTGAQKPADLVKKGLLTKPEAATLDRALRFFWTVRCHLHLLAGRAEDRLAFDAQPRLAELMGYKDKEPNRRAEKFMKDYFLLAREVGHLTRTLCAKLEAQSLKAKKLVLAESVEGFPVKNNRLTLGGKDPLDIIRLFRVSQTADIDIHPDALRHIRAALPVLRKQGRKAYPLFLDILLDTRRAEQSLRRMNEAGVLGALIPAFDNIVAHMQYDMYHSFTADEHTIHAVGLLHELENGLLATVAPLATELFHKTKSRRELYVAMLLHDIAKGTGADHSAAGADIARGLCPLLGLTPEETETASWLVQEHLLMTLTAYKRDLGDPKTVADFAAAVQSPDRLKLLTILTTADIMAVGPERWNNWKSGLLAELYQKTAALLADVKPPLPRPRNDNIEPGKTTVKITPHLKHDYTEVVVTTADRKGLFATLAGALAASGASIVAARIFTLPSGMVQDVFQVQTLKGHVYENSAYLSRTIKAALDGKLDLAAEIRTRQKAAPKKAALFATPVRVVIDNEASTSNTVIEVSGADKPGFLHAVTAALSAEGLQISAAKVATFGSRAVDVFYVRDAFGLKILHAGKLKTIETTLKRALEEAS